MYELYNGNNYYVGGTGGTVTSGQTTDYNYTTCSSTYNGTIFVVFNTQAGGVSIGGANCVNTPSQTIPWSCAGSAGPFSFSIYGGSQFTTNYYCVYHVQWTNCGSTYAQFGGVIVDGAGTVRDISTMIQGDNSLAAAVVSPLAPGHYVDLYVTNNMGTNNLGCGSWIAGDYRDHVVECPTETGGGSKYSYTSGTYSTGGGTFTGGGGPVAGGNTNSPGGYSGGTTNPVQQKDIYKLIDANNLGLANVERGLAIVNSNVLAGIS